MLLARIFIMISLFLPFDVYASDEGDNELQACIGSLNKAYKTSLTLHKNDFARNFRIYYSSKLQLLSTRSGDLQKWRSIIIDNTKMKVKGVSSCSHIRIVKAPISLFFSSSIELTLNSLLDGKSAPSGIDYNVKYSNKNFNMKKLNQEFSKAINSKKNNTSRLIVSSDDRFESNKKSSILNTYICSEKHPLGGIEWIKVIGLINGNFKDGVTYMKKFKTSYDSIGNIRNRLRGVPFLIGYDNGMIWRGPGGRNSLTRLIREAGGIVKTGKNDDGSFYAYFDKMSHLSNNKNAQILIYTGERDFNKNEGLYDIYKKIPAVKNNNIYSFLPGNFVLNNYCIRPDLMLLDFIQMMNKEKLKEINLHFFKKN